MTLIEIGRLSYMLFKHQKLRQEMQYDTYQVLTPQSLNTKILVKNCQNEIFIRRTKSQRIWNLPRYLLSANDKFTLALVCAWGGDRKITSLEKYSRNFEKAREEKPRKYFWNLSRYLLCANDIITLALACAWREIIEITPQTKRKRNRQQRSGQQIYANNLISSQVLVIFKRLTKISTSLSVQNPSRDMLCANGQ